MISTFRNSLRDAALDFAWWQWTQVGVAGRSNITKPQAVDPEALILFTVSIARSDPRLFDEVLDWLAQNVRLVSLQRLRNLAKNFPIESNLIEATVAWVSEQSTAVRWSTTPPPRNPPREPLFDPSLVSLMNEPDEVFARYGYLRPAVQRSSNSTEPPVKAPAALAFRLRLMFGLGTRAEILRILLGTAPQRHDAAWIADEAGFAKRNVSDALSSLASAGVIRSEWTGNERSFWVHRSEWARLLEPALKTDWLPAHRSWISILPAVLLALDWLDHHADGASAYLLASQVRDLIESITPLLNSAGLEVAGPGWVEDVEDTAVLGHAIEALIKAIS